MIAAVHQARVGGAVRHAENVTGLMGRRRERAAQTQLEIFLDVSVAVDRPDAGALPQVGLAEDEVPAPARPQAGVTKDPVFI